MLNWSIITSKWILQKYYLNESSTSFYDLLSLHDRNANGSNAAFALQVFRLTMMLLLNRLFQSILLAYCNTKFREHRAEAEMDKQKK
jgi:hypothetical protein